jgi:membrane protein implicated in regulation of membrane protease activity
MTWATFYLICFALGFSFSFLSFVLGGFRLHLPQSLGGGQVHAHTPHVHVADGGGPTHSGSHVSLINPVTLAAFLAWFGGIGYLVTRFSAVWMVIGLGIAMLSGITGAGIIYLFLSRVLTSREENLDPADFEMTGVLGRVSVPIREGGTGEMIYSQAGTRRVCGARADDGALIAKNCEVVVTRYEKGIAYVRLFADLANEEPDSAVSGKNGE